MKQIKMEIYGRFLRHQLICCPSLHRRHAFCATGSRWQRYLQIVNFTRHQNPAPKDDGRARYRRQTGYPDPSVPIDHDEHHATLIANTVRAPCKHCTKRADS